MYIRLTLSYSTALTRNVSSLRVVESLSSSHGEVYNIMFALFEKANIYDSYIRDLDSTAHHTRFE